MKKYLLLLMIILCFGHFGVHVAKADVTYYVDPDYTGGSSDGSAAHPWTIITNASTPQWNVINASLATQNVTINCAARQAGSDVDEVYGSPSDIELTNETASSTFTLTFNGNSFYNTNNAVPSWQPYSGNSKCNVSSFNTENLGHIQVNNIVVNGFRISNTGDNGIDKAVTICGNNWTLENSDIFASTSVNAGPLVLIVPTSNAVDQGTNSFCPASSGITIQNNTLHDSFGESIYIGGGGCSIPDPTASTSDCGGFPAHSNILIQNNTIHDGGVQGGQGDGIDIKGGISNLTIINNTIYNMNDPHNQGIRAIVSQGVRNGDPFNNYVIADNTIYNITDSDAAITLGNTWGTPRSIYIFNNTIANSKSDGILVDAGDNINLYNNTIYQSGSFGIQTTNLSTTTVINNILFNNSSGHSQTSLAATTTINNNGFSFSWGGTTCNSCISGVATSSFVNASALNFNLVASSPLVQSGQNLSFLCGSVSSLLCSDLAGTPRPPTGPWDIGAYESFVASIVSSVLKGLFVLTGSFVFI